MNYYYGIEIDGEAMKGFFADALSEEDKAEAAMLEWLNDRIDLGPDAPYTGKAHHAAWWAYCVEKGNCDYEDFDDPLWKAFGKAKGEVARRGSASELKCTEEMQNDLGETLYECHH